MEYNKPMNEITKEDMIREFDFEYKREQSYFDYMYRSVQFSFVAIVAVFITASELFTPYSNNKMLFFQVLLSYVLPTCLYVFGTMYTFNAYALSLCGDRAAKLHKMIYSGKQYKNNCTQTNMIKQYFLTDHRLSILSYGVTLGFYMVVPLACLVIVWLISWSHLNFFFFVMLPSVFYGIYLVILILLILRIRNQFITPNRKNKPDSLHCLHIPIRCNTFREKETRQFAISGRMKARHTILKGDRKPAVQRVKTRRKLYS